MTLIERISSLVKNLVAWLSPVKTTVRESKGVQLLSGVLVLQLAVAGALMWRSQTSADFVQPERLVNVDPSLIDEIVLDDREGRVSLMSIENQWRMDDGYETLADAGKISQLLSDLSDLKPGLPVANTTGSHLQLEVGEDSFQRRITLKASGTSVAELYLGTSPGFRKSHIRRADQPQVYAARLDTFDLNAEHDDWLDRNLLAVDNITGIESDDVELALIGEQWAIANPQDKIDTHEIDQAGIVSLIERLNKLEVTGFARPFETDKPSDVAVADDESAPPELSKHSITVLHDGEPVTLQFSRNDNHVTIERSDVDGAFGLPLGIYEELTPESIARLLVEKSADSSSVDVDPPQG